MLPKLSTAKRLQLILGMSILGLLVTSGRFYWTQKYSAIHGPAYNQIVQGKDVIADILPPPEYIVEPYLVVHRMVLAQQSGQSAEVSRCILELELLKSQFQERHEFWERDLQDPEMRQLMLTDLYEPAHQFFQVAETQLISACERSETAKAIDVLQGPLAQLYTQHRNAVNSLSTLATSKNSQMEQQAVEAIAEGNLWCLAVMILTTVSVTGFGLYTIRSAVTPLRKNAYTLCAKAREAGAAAQEISAAVGRLDDSIREISQNAHHAESVCATAKESVNKTCQVLHGLSSSSTQIGEVIQLIQRITHQTNLLALNATIEAARAGEAGLGFAVVAREVKELASQTNEAASSITQHIAAIQSETHSALSSIEMVNEVVNAIHQSQAEIASAVTQQSDMTMLLSRNIQNMASTSLIITDAASQLLNPGRTPMVAGVSDLGWSGDAGQPASGHSSFTMA